MIDYPYKLSVIIPIYNESARIGPGLKIIKDWHSQFPEWEFILIDDGSTDDTVDRINKLKFIKLISYQNNQGKGFALKQGVAQATKPLVLISDIDFSSPLTELPKLATAIKQADLVIGSRKTLGAKIIKHQPWWREYLGRQFTNLSKLWLCLKVSDVTCGFKLLKTSAAKELFKRQKIKRWSYDAEVLFLAKKMKLRVVDIPVLWKNDEQTKVSIFKDIFQSVRDLWQIRFNDWLQKY